MEKINFNKVLSDLHDSIGKQTLHNNYDTVELLLANLNSIYGMLLLFEGDAQIIFPIRSIERAQKFMVLIHTISAFQFGTSISDMLIKGQYPEADALTRSLIETVAFAEYYKMNPDVAFQIVGNPENLPSRKTVFRFLAENGIYPSGGPKKAFERYNSAAHGNITSAALHWMEGSGNPQVTNIWIRGYNSKSFYEIARDQVIPLLGIQQIFRDIFIDEENVSRETPWLKYWILGHNRELIMRIFPEIEMPDKDNNGNHV